MTENWKPVVGFETNYEVSDLGRVRSLARTDGRGRKWAAQFMTLQDHTEGYVQVSLSKDCVKTRKYVHHLVMDAFLGPCPQDKERNHISGDKTDNSLSNMEYVTRSANHLHAYKKLGKQHMHGERHGNAKLSYDDVVKIRQLHATGDFTQRKLALDFHVSPSAIQQVLNGERWATDI